MKQLFYLFGLILLFVACDKENPYPEGEEPTGPIIASEPFIGTLITPSTVDPVGASSSVVKNLLLEDYTGFKCTNCPDAHEVADEIRTDHGDQVIVMSMHVSSSFAEPEPGAVFPEPFSQDFRTEAGETYVSQFGIAALPSGIINRRKFDNQLPVSFEAWPGAVDGVIDEPGQVGIEIGNVTFDGDTLDVFCEIEFIEDLEGQFYVSMHLVEDEVVSAQINGGSTILDYVQKDVYRGALNGTFGDSLKTDPEDLDLFLVEGHYFLPGTSTTPNVPNPQIEMGDCHVVVFVYKLDEAENEYEIFQVVKKDVSI